jgi:hypothetical protein
MSPALLRNTTELTGQPTYIERFKAFLKSNTCGRLGTFVVKSCGADQEYESNRTRPPLLAQRWCPKRDELFFSEQKLRSSSNPFVMLHQTCNQKIQLGMQADK